MPAIKQLRLSLCDRDHRKVRLVAASQGISMAAFATRAIRRHSEALLHRERAALGPAETLSDFNSLAPHPWAAANDPRHGLRIGVRLSEADHERLRQAATAAGLAMAEFARRAVMQDVMVAATAAQPAS